MATPERTGTASEVDASAGDGNVNVTVPSDATLAVAIWSHWDNNGGSSLATLSLNSASFTIQAQTVEGLVTNQPGVGIATLEAPATGTQNLAWTYSGGGARAEGGWILVTWIKGHKSGDPFSDVGTDAEVANNNVEVVLANAVADELVIAAAQSFNTPPVMSGTLYAGPTAVNLHQFEGRQAIATGAHTVTMTDENFSSMAAISLKEPTGLTFSGTMSPAASAISAAMSAIVELSGTLSGLATLSGNLTVFDRQFDGSLSAALASISGTADILIGLSGTMASQASALSGAMSALVDFDGSLLVNDATLAGSIEVSVIPTFSGDLGSQRSFMAGDIDPAVALAGALYSKSPSLSLEWHIRFGRTDTGWRKDRYGFLLTVGKRR